jgi:hypothetical protein
MTLNYIKIKQRFFYHLDKETDVEAGLSYLILDIKIPIRFEFIKDLFTDIFPTSLSRNEMIPN